MEPAEGQAPAAAKMIRGYLAFYKVEGALVDLEKARALGVVRSGSLPLSVLN